MHTKEVYRVCSRCGEVVSVIALEAQEMARAASQPVPPGETIKGQLRRASRALGYPDGSWRLREAWYGRAGCWSARAIEDLRARYRTWDDRQAALAAEQDKTHAALLRAGVASKEANGDAKLDRKEARYFRDHAQLLEHVGPGCLAD